MHKELQGSHVLDPRPGALGLPVHPPASRSFIHECNERYGDSQHGSVARVHFEQQ